MGLSGISSAYSNPYFTLRNYATTTTNNQQTNKPSATVANAPAISENNSSAVMSNNVTAQSATQSNPQPANTNAAKSSASKKIEISEEAIAALLSEYPLYNAGFDYAAIKKTRAELPLAEQQIDENGAAIFDDRGNPLVVLTAEHRRFYETVVLHLPAKSQRDLPTQYTEINGQNFAFAKPTYQVVLQVYPGGDGNYYDENGGLMFSADELPKYRILPKDFERNMSVSSPPGVLGGKLLLDYDRSGFLCDQRTGRQITEEELYKAVVTELENRAKWAAAEEKRRNTPIIEDYSGRKLAENWLLEEYPDIAEKRCYDTLSIRDNLLERLSMRSGKSIEELADEIGDFAIAENDSPFAYPLVRLLYQMLGVQNGKTGSELALQTIKTYQRANDSWIGAQFVYECCQAGSDGIPNVIDEFTQRLNIAYDNLQKNLRAEEQRLKELAEAWANRQPPAYQPDDLRLQIFSQLGVTDTADNYFVNNLRWFDPENNADNQILTVINNIFSKSTSKFTRDKVTDILSSYHKIQDEVYDPEAKMNYANYIAKVTNIDYIDDLKNKSLSALTKNEKLMLEHAKYLDEQGNKHPAYEIIDGQIYYVPSTYNYWMDTPWEKWGLTA